MQTHEISDARIDTLIPNIGADTDIARLVHAIEPYRYKYYGNQLWAMYDSHKDIWVPDKKGVMVWDDIQLWLGNKLMQRALYWKTMADASDATVLQRYEYSRNADILIRISQSFDKRKRPNCRKEMLEELKIFYVVNQ